jgi:hypothetical protein
MRHRGTPPSLDAATIAAILRRLTPEERASIREQQRELDLSVLAHFELMLGSGWGALGDGLVDHVWRQAAEHWRAILAEREADELEAELGRLQAVEVPIEPIDEVPAEAAAETLEKPADETPTESTTSVVMKLHPAETDYRADVTRMRKLRGTGKAPSYYAAAKRQPGGENKNTRDRLVAKYRKWEAAGFPPFDPPLVED